MEEERGRKRDIMSYFLPLFHFMAMIEFGDFA
jgi:hypothetical protein